MLLMKNNAAAVISGASLLGAGLGHLLVLLLHLTCHLLPALTVVPYSAPVGASDDKMGDVSGEFSGGEEKGRENGVRQVLEETDGGSAHQVLVRGGGKIPPQGSQLLPVQVVCGPALIIINSYLRSPGPVPGMASVAYGKRRAPRS